MNSNTDQNLTNEPNSPSGADNHDAEYIIQSKVSKTFINIKQFLANPDFITEKGDQRTNIINVAEKKTYFIQNQYLDSFFTMLEACRRENKTMHYSERQETSEYGHSGIMIDFDRYQSSKDTQITSSVLDILINRLTKIIAETIDFSLYEKNNEFIYHIFIIKKAAPDLTPGDGAPVYKDGFHLLIPELQVIKGYKKFLLNEILDKKILQSMFRNVVNINPPEKDLDLMSASVPVHFFGSAKPGKKMYPLTYAYEIKNIPIDDMINIKELDVKALLAGEHNLTYELSLVCSLDSIGGKPTWLKKQPIEFKISLEQKIQLLTEKTAKDIEIDEADDVDSNVDSLTVTDPDAKRLQDLLALLDISYATEYEKWFKVICAIAHTSARYRDLAKWFSMRKPEGWSPAEFDRVWEEAIRGANNKNPVTLRSLVFWARDSSPDKFNQIEESHYKRILLKLTFENDGRVEHAIAAKVLWHMIGSKFIVDVDKNDAKVKKEYIWYEFVIKGQSMEHGEVYKWRQESSPDNIHLYITEHLPKVYREVGRFIKERRENAEDENTAKYLAGVDKTFRMYMSKLHNDGFQEGIIKQARYRFRCRGFINELDQDPLTIGVGNGVLLLSNKQGVPELIKSFHEHRISKYTSTNYIPYDKNNKYVKILKQAFADIFIERDMYKFILYYLSTCVSGFESNALLLILCGGGQNGKTFIALLLQKTLGDMYISAGKPSLLTAPNERGNESNSALMAMKDKRGFYFDEFQQCEKLNVARVKSIANPGYQSARDLHRKQENFVSKCNPFALTNFELGIDTTDHGTWRRIKSYRTKVKFTNNPDPARYPYEKKVDTRFMNNYIKDPAFLSAFLSILVHYFGKLRNKYCNDINNVIAVTPTLIRESLIYRNSQDSLNRFITTMIVKTSQPTEEPSDLGLSLIASKYIEWYNKTINTHNKLNVNDVMSQLENSNLQSEIKRKNGMLMACDVRIKTFLEEPLRDGETPIEDVGISAKEMDDAANQPTFIGDAPKSFASMQDDDLIILNDKLWIQKTEAPKVTVTEEDLLRMIEQEKQNDNTETVE